MGLMWTEHLDLHSHSTHSDGEHAVETVAAFMAAEGVRTWSLTDHDTTSGWKEGAVAALKHGMRFVPGVEITCEPALSPNRDHLQELNRDRASSSWHLLAYFPHHEPGTSNEGITGFHSWLAPRQDGRGPRMQAMCHRLTELGMPVNYQNVERRAGGSVGRPHLAEEMIDLGYVSSKQEAFERWIGDGLPGFVPHQKPSIAEAVQAVKAAGGITSLAHPLYYGVPPTTLCKTLADLGVNAVETVHRSHSDAYRFSLQQAAEANGLSTTVGSDFHGLKSQTRPGHMPVPVGMLPKSLMDV